MEIHAVIYHGTWNYEYTTAWIPIQNLPQNIHETQGQDENMNNRDETGKEEMVPV